MGLVLCSGDQSRLASTLTALLSPLASPSPEQWFSRITRELRELLHCETSQVAMILRGATYNFSADCPALAVSLGAATSFDRGELHFHETEMELGLLQRRRRRMAVFTSSLLDRCVGGKRRSSDFYNDVCVPVGALETYGLLVTGPEGEALVGVNCGANPHYDPLASETMALLSLVLPALQSGVETLGRVGSALQVLAATLDGHDLGMFVFDIASGRELHRNLAARSMLAAAREKEAVEREVRAISQSLRRAVMSNRRSAGDAVRRAVGVRAGGDELRLSATYLPPGAFGGAGVLVTVERSMPQLPSDAFLRTELGLTTREAEITLRVAAGQSDPTIARGLGISTHTVGHHVERSFLKLGVHSRKGLGLCLLARLRQSARP